MRRRLFAAAGVVALALVPVVALSGPASATAASAVGYWSKASAPGPLAPILAPPNVPEGGVYVAKDPSGPAAVATVRYPITEPGGGTFTLQVGQASTIQTATLNICPVAGPWEPTVNGAFAAQPANGCADLMINGSVSDDATSVSFFIPETFPLNGGTLEMFIVAAESSTPFTVAFEAPDDTSFEPTSSGGSAPFPEFEGGAGSGAGSDSGFAPSGGTDPATGGSSGGFTGGSSGSGGGSFSAPSGGSSGDPFTPGTVASGGGGDFSAPSSPEVATPGAGGTETAFGGTDGATPGTTASNPTLASSRGGDDGTARAFAIGTLVAIAAGMFFLSARGSEAPLALATAAGRTPAPVGGAVVAPSATRRGVGRFARPRLQPPVRL